MAKIAFILLCHKEPEAIIAQAERLTAMGDFIAIHFDARANAADHAKVTAALADNPRVAFAKRRVKCGWGEWSLVRASLNALEVAVETFPQASHFYLISGDCMPTKSARYAHAFLDARDCDYIESVDFFTSGWIKTGMQEDRLIYRHYVNERGQKKLFYALLNAQRKLGLKRALPKDLEIMIGSQWWCLRRSTCETILAFCAERRDVLRFFATTWIPDETFFQTLVRHLVPRDEIDSRTPTFLMFTDYGLPVTFYNDHYDLLLSQNSLFARKISPQAQHLKARLGALWASDRSDFPLSGDGRRLFKFLTQRGREGRLFAPRFWQQGGSLGYNRQLFLLVCKKWHVAKRMAARASDTLGVPSLAYFFDELDHTHTPDLGGIQASLDKRNRNRRATLRMMFDTLQTDRLILCVDPSKFDLLAEVYADHATVSTIQLACDFDDAYLHGHATRIGLVGDRTPPETVAQLMPTLRYDFTYEMERIGQSDFPHLSQIDAHSSRDHRIEVARSAFNCTRDDAEKIADTPHLFTD